MHPKDECGQQKCTRNTTRNAYDLLMTSVSQCDIYIVYKVHYIILKFLSCETLIPFNFSERPEGSKAVEINIVLIIFLEGEVLSFSRAVTYCRAKSTKTPRADAVCCHIVVTLINFPIELQRIIQNPYSVGTCIVVDALVIVVHKAIDDTRIQPPQDQNVYGYNEIQD